MKQGKQYGITIAIGIAIVLLICWIQGLFTTTPGAMDAATAYHILCDAFCVSGVLLAGAGMLVFSNNEGGFDAIVFGVKSFAGLFKKNRKTKQTDYDYRMSRAEHKVPFLFMVITGLFFLAIAAVMLALHMSCR